MTPARADAVFADPLIRMPRGVRLHQDRVRGLPALLGPERALMLDEIGLAILSELGEGVRLSVLIDRLAARYDAPRDEIAGDVRAFLDVMQVQRLVDYADA
ncbi:pyrroloquinoline quinone biosynthesis peptide chaperone PqqD [Pararhodobacter sp. SW119]|uniref:pyrroloquinoline quinone biosynthesis peptide chaperone PqqD n=1 Tax=Pararhodobacter sp. SW119 TaxID=2780075 RepID=UPI001FD80B8F|nr:pyrroloquinoline quinone biosynthesis peptide chaperone PqqD [Pararhodobacter sp. SW119]